MCLAKKRNRKKENQLELNMERRIFYLCDIFQNVRQILHDQFKMYRDDIRES